MKTTLLKGVLLASTMFVAAGSAYAADVTLIIESWRNDDLTICRKKSSLLLKPRTQELKLNSPLQHLLNIMRR